MEKATTTTEEQFKYFVSRFRYWYDYLKLAGWEVSFYHEELKEDFARIGINYKARNVSVVFNTDWPEDKRPLNETEIDRCARHEAVHLLTGSLWCLAFERYSSEAAIDTAEEELVRRIEEIVGRGEDGI